MPENYIEYLKSLELFSDLDADAIQILEASIEWVEFDEGQVIFQEDDAADAMYFVVHGRLQVTARLKSGEHKPIATLMPDGLFGEISLVSGAKRTATIKADQPTALIRLPKEAFDRLTSRVPQLIDKIADLARERLRRSQLLNILPSFIAHVDEKTRLDIEEQLKWVDLERGEILFQQGEPSDSIYLVISGRLRAFITDKFGEYRILNDIPHGEIVGEMAFFTQETRSAGVCAVHKSTLAKLDRQLFEDLIKRHPEVMMAVVRRLISRLKSAQDNVTYKDALNIAVVPAQPEVPITEFSVAFERALSSYGMTFHLNRERFDNFVGIKGGTEKLAASDPYSIRLDTWLDEQEKTHNFVLYEAEHRASTWSKRCIQQADIVIVVANAKGKLKLEEMAVNLLAKEDGLVKVKQTLVLLHDESEQEPVGTSDWVALTKVESHCHIRRNRGSDFDRLARIVSGRAVGLVLGGGGARGFAHIGVIRALEEVGIPIDMIGGTSMGAIISAQYAIGWHYSEMLDWNRKTFVEMKPHRDFTLPIISLTRGLKGEKVSKMLYGDRQIEDLWIDYFCVSSSLSGAKAVVHQHGLLRKAVTASSSLPGIAVPVIEHGNLLIDGGLINNLPADVMKHKCQGDVIAVDVGAELNLTSDVEHMPSPWKVLWSRLGPFQEPISTITIFDVLVGATFVGGDSRLENLKETADYYLRPPVEKYSLLGLEHLQEIAETGYEYAMKQIETWDKEGRLGLLS